MARNIFTKGTAITLAWHFTKPDGSSFDLSGYQLRLFYGVGSRYTEVSGFSRGTNASDPQVEDYISWVFEADKQFTAGDYKMKLQLYQNGQLFTTFNYNDAFALYQGTPYSNNDEQQTEEAGTVNLYTAAEFYLFKPIEPVVGTDGFWRVNGVLVRDGSNNPVPSYYDVRYDEDTRWLSIYKGNPDDPGTPEPDPIQVIKDVDDALKHWNEQYLAEEGSLAESEAGDDDRWGQYKMNEGTLEGSEAGDSDRWGQYQSNEAERDAEYAAAEGTSSSSSSENSRWGKYKAAESTRNVQYTQQEGSKAGSSVGGSDRWGQYKAAEAARDAERLAAEGDSSASATDNTRWGKYKAAENTRDAARLAVEGNSDSAKDNTTRWGAYKLAEDARDAARLTAEGSAASTAGDASRWGKFKEQEGTLDSSEADDGSRWGQYKEEEGTEDSSYTEHSRWGNYQAAEITRGNDYSEAEGSADGSASGDGSRWGSYKLQEGTNNDAASASGSRWARYKNAENDREAAYETAEGEATAASSASGSRWARFNKAQDDRDIAYSTAEAARNAGMAPLVGIFDCSTAAATAQKEVTASNYVLTNGGAFKVKFTYANSASSPALKINSETAKAIVFNGAVASADNTWGAGEVVEFYYDPTYDSNAGGFIGRSTVVSVSQNSQTGALLGKITIGNTDYDIKAEALDSTPTAGHTNGVTSGGVKSALDAQKVTVSQNSQTGALLGKINVGSTEYDIKAEALDSTPTAEHTNGVTSGGVKTALDAQKVSVSQNTETGHTDITIGDTTTPVASVEEVSQLGQEIYGKIEGEYTITGYNNKCLTLNLKEGFTYTFKVDSSSSGTLYRKVCDSEGNSIYNPGSTSEIPNSFSFTPSQDYSGAYLELGMSGTNTFSITVTTIGLIESAIKGWILSEAFNIQNGTYTDGIINSPVSIIWPDGVMGTLIITRGDNALVNTISATHGSDSYLLSITRDNNGFVTGTNIIKQ